MTDQSLSPVAQAIRDAYENCDELEAAVAAALRTAAPLMECVQDRHKLLTIANELES